MVGVRIGREACNKKHWLMQAKKRKVQQGTRIRPPSGKKQRDNPRIGKQAAAASRTLPRVCSCISIIMCTPEERMDAAAASKPIRTISSVASLSKMDRAL